MSFKQFQLPCDNFNSLFTNYELNRPAVVVSIIGRDSLNGLTEEISKFPHFMDNVCDILVSSRGPSSENCEFDGYYDREENVVYLVLKGPMDSEYLLKGLELAQKQAANNGFLDFWSRVRNQFARALLFMFSCSHIVLLTDPGYSPNSNLIRLFKIMSFVRPKYHSAITRALGKCRGLSEDWAFHGRLCSPRLLFLFKDCPYEIQEEPCLKDRILRVKKLEHSLEDQIYISLRKSRLVKNVCSRAFFSIAPNDEFVFVQIRQTDSFEAMSNSLYEQILINISNSTDEKTLLGSSSGYADSEYEMEPDCFLTTAAPPSESSTSDYWSSASSTINSSSIYFNPESSYSTGMVEVFVPAYCYSPYSDLCLSDTTHTELCLSDSTVSGNSWSDPMNMILEDSKTDYMSAETEYGHFFGKSKSFISNILR